MDVEVVRNPEKLHDPRDRRKRKAESGPLDLRDSAPSREAKAEHGSEREEQSENGHTAGVPALTVLTSVGSWYDREVEESMRHHPAGKRGVVPLGAPRLDLVRGES